MLQVKNLIKMYRIGKSKERVTALSGVSIDFPEKGLVFLLGKSGSGKSTLLNAIGGLDTFDSGEIIIKGKSSADFTQADFDSYRNTFIGFIFQEYNILEEFTVAKNLSIALELQGKKADKEEVDKLLDQVDMLEYGKRKPNQLSGGQKQRVAIARALIKNPEIIMADEPTGALDSNTGKQVMDTLKKLSKEKLVIIVSHDREFAEIYGDRIIELKDGKIIQDITKKEVEPAKTQSGVSIIDNSIIHIKKGTPLTNDDIRHINEVLTTQSRNTDILISIDDKANQQVKKASFITDEGNKETFVQTSPEDTALKKYDPKEFKLIKSQLKFKDSFKMGASALKNKVWKLVFTIFLSFLAFGMFGVVDTLSTFNRADAVFSTIELTGEKHLSLLKEAKADGYPTRQPTSASDLSKFQQDNQDIIFQPVVGTNARYNQSIGYYSSSDSNKLYINNLMTSGTHPAYEPYTSGVVDISESKLKNLGFELLPGGKLPEDVDPGIIEICISKHLYECYKNNNPDTIKSESDILNKTCTLRNDYSNSSMFQYKIVGIIDNHEDLSEFYNMDTEALNSFAGMMTESKMRTILNYGYNSMIYTTKTHFDQLSSRKLSTSAPIWHEGDEYASNNLELQRLDTYQNKKNNYYNELPDYYYQNFNDNFYIKNNAKLASPAGIIPLADNEIILYRYCLSYIISETDNASESELMSAIEAGVTIKLRQTDNSADDVIGDPLTVVGYTNYYGTIISNDKLKLALSEYPTVYVFNSEDQYFGHNYYTEEIRTPSETFKSQYSFDSKITYYNGTEDYTGEVTLKEDEIILPLYYMFGNDNYISDESARKLAAQSMIANRSCKITLKEYNDEDSPTICTFTVVGYNEYDNETCYISEEYLNTYIKDRVYGYDYVIASIGDNVRAHRDFITSCEKYNEDNIKFAIQNGSTSVLDNFGNTIEQVASILIWFALGIAIFASLLLMNFISTSISYKKREIGILRALGARGSDVFGIFFNESLIIAGINFVLASIATITTCIIINTVVVADLGLDLVFLSVGIRQFALMLGISVLSAFIASFIPVFRIARKKPIDAINNR